MCRRLSYLLRLSETQITFNCSKNRSARVILFEFFLKWKYFFEISLFVKSTQFMYIYIQYRNRYPTRTKKYNLLSQSLTFFQRKKKIVQPIFVHHSVVITRSMKWNKMTKNKTKLPTLNPLSEFNFQPTTLHHSKSTRNSRQFLVSLGIMFALYYTLILVNFACIFFYLCFYCLFNTKIRLQRAGCMSS